jgi:hypothetical protein
VPRAAMNFFLKFQWLCGLCNRDPNESTALFIDKLKFNEIKKAVRMANFTNAERYDVPYPELQIESDVQRMLFRHRIDVEDAAKLEKAGFVTLNDFFNCDESDKEFEDLVKSFSTIPKWKRIKNFFREVRSGDFQKKIWGTKYDGKSVALLFAQAWNISYTWNEEMKIWRYEEMMKWGNDGKSVALLFA